MPARHATRLRGIATEPVVVHLDRGLRCDLLFTRRSSTPERHGQQDNSAQFTRIFAGHWTRPVIAAVAPYTG